MNTYFMTGHIGVPKNTIDRNIRKAKALKLQHQANEHGYNFCEITKKNQGTVSLDCSHIISVDECQKSGRSELSWDLKNIQILSRDEHYKIEKMTHEEREKLYCKVNGINYIPCDKCGMNYWEGYAKKCDC